MSLTFVTHSSGSIGTSSSGVSQRIYVMPWEELSLEDTNILRVTSEPELSDRTIWLDKYLLQYSVKDIFYTKAPTFEWERWITAGIDRRDSSETSIQYRPGHGALEQLSVMVEKQDNWNRNQRTIIILLTSDHVKSRMEGFLDYANSAIHSWFNPFILNDLPFHINDSFHADIIMLLEGVKIFEMEKPTTAYIVRNDFYKTIILSQQKT